LSGANIARQVGLVRLRSGISSEFVSYYLQSPDGVTLLGANTGGSVQLVINLADLRNVGIPIPPIPEQRRIVGILDEAFDGIATAKANAEKNLQNARAVFESHLQAVFSQGAKSAVPLSSLLSVQPRNGWSPPAEYQTGTGIPVLTLSSVTGFEYDGSRVKLSSVPARDDAHYWLEKGELLITRSNTRELVGHVAICDGTPPRAICCDLIMKMRVDPTKALTRFVYFYLRSPGARSYLTSRAQGASSTMKKIGKAVVQNMPIPSPSLAQQKSITAKLDALLAETQRLESLYRQKLAALDALKRSLLDQVFSGVL
jgi:type I restriction enzyme S subunit